MTSKLTIISSTSAEFSSTLLALRRRGDTDLERVEPAVRQILNDVAKGGDQAVRDYVQKFERRTPGQLLLRDYGGEAALNSLA
ncbi:MAG TPA: hypothetical protein VN764_11965, partial [Polyangiaceae bacterium]|nr:hypothetical protein [Polyangiaceae bacterium]